MVNLGVGVDQSKRKQNILKFKDDWPKTKKSSAADRFKENTLLVPSGADSSIKPTWKVPKLPFKVLDAPQLKDDFYLNLLDWSSQNILAVGLGSAVYIWSACNSKVTKLCESTPDKPITSVSWS